MKKRDIGKNVYKSCCLCIAFAVGFVGLADTVKAGTLDVLYYNHFENASQRAGWSTQYLALKERTNNWELQAKYVPSSRGSERITDEVNLSSKVRSATLNYDVRFHSKFEFVRTGKLHGLGGGSATTGCNAKTSRGWSARVIWDVNGVASIYVYHQNRVSSCGDRWTAQDFRFEAGKTYRVSLYVSLNSAPNVADGIIELYVDGVKIASANGVRLSGRSDVKIDKFLFHTFHGGSNSSYSPTKNVFTYFDNFLIMEGKNIVME
ncbi:polysaccharide lyase [Shewanella waksmanii]|uniref:polysaccharide lyase n=1 Tax=Shewanella waksmanii TaxID=213783 RepID=UPI0004904F73|nr:hypothetical protein [Shewanella waksmanii]